MVPLFLYFSFILSISTVYSGLIKGGPTDYPPSIAVFSNSPVKLVYTSPDQDRDSFRFSNAREYWKLMNKALRDCIHTSAGCSQDTSILEETKISPQFTSSGISAFVRKSNQNNFPGPRSFKEAEESTGVCPVNFVCINWQLCRNGVIVYDGTGSIDPTLTDMPLNVKSTHKTCGKGMVCCSVFTGNCACKLTSENRSTAGHKTISEDLKSFNLPEKKFAPEEPFNLPIIPSDLPTSFNSPTQDFFGSQINPNEYSDVHTQIKDKNYQSLRTSELPGFIKPQKTSQRTGDFEPPKQLVPPSATGTLLDSYDLPSLEFLGNKIKGVENANKRSGLVPQSVKSTDLKKHATPPNINNGNLQGLINQRRLTNNHNNDFPLIDSFDLPSVSFTGKPISPFSDSNRHTDKDVPKKTSLKSLPEVDFSQNRNTENSEIETKTDEAYTNKQGEEQSEAQQALNLADAKNNGANINKENSFGLLDSYALPSLDFNENPIKDNRTLKEKTASTLSDASLLLPSFPIDKKVTLFGDDRKTTILDDLNQSNPTSNNLNDKTYLLNQKKTSADNYDDNDDDDTPTSSKDVPNNLDNKPYLLNQKKTSADDYDDNDDEDSPTSSKGVPNNLNDKTYLLSQKKTSADDYDDNDDGDSPTSSKDVPDKQTNDIKIKPSTTKYDVNIKQNEKKQVNDISPYHDSTQIQFPTDNNTKKINVPNVKPNSKPYDGTQRRKVSEPTYGNSLTSSPNSLTDYQIKGTDTLKTKTDSQIKSTNTLKTKFDSSPASKNTTSSVTNTSKPGTKMMNMSMSMPMAMPMMNSRNTMMMGNMVMRTLLGTPLIGQGCSAGTFCVNEEECNPYNGFIFMYEDQKESFARSGTLEVPTVPVMNCSVPTNNVLNGICCQLPHPILGPKGQFLD